MGERAFIEVARVMENGYSLKSLTVATRVDA